MKNEVFEGLGVQKIEKFEGLTGSKNENLREVNFLGVRCGQPDCGGGQACGEAGLIGHYVRKFSENFRKKNFPK